MDQKLTERVHLLMSPSELHELDDWMFANRLRSRGEAIRRLIERGRTPPNDAAPAEQAAATSNLPAAPVPPGGWPWLNASGDPSIDLNVKVSPRLKSKLDWLASERKRSKHPAFHLREIATEAMEAHANRELRSRGASV